MYAVGVVLGDVVTPEIGAAWSSYVLWIARKFIERELEIYEQAALRDYGWFGFKVTPFPKSCFLPVLTFAW